jgi:hypothetical protein
MSTSRDLGIILKDQGRLDEAEPYNVENVEVGRRVLGDRHPEQLAGVINLASFYQAQGRCEEAERLAGESAATLAEVCERAGRPADAARWRAELARGT